MKGLGFAAAAAAVLLLSSVPGEARMHGGCPMYYKPVCARTVDGHKKTFTNAVCARVAHARVLYPGRCRWRH